MNFFFCLTASGGSSASADDTNGKTKKILLNQVYLIAPSEVCICIYSLTVFWFQETMDKTLKPYPLVQVLMVIKWQAETVETN